MLQAAGEGRSRISLAVSRACHRTGPCGRTRSRPAAEL